MTELAQGAEGWRPDPFGRHESRFYDGSRWTPHVRDGDTHGLDEPVGAPAREGADAPGLLTATVLVVELHTDVLDRAAPCAVHGDDGRVLGSVRRAMGDADELEVVDADGRPVLRVSRTTTATRKTILTVRDAERRDLGRIVQQHLPGVTSFTIESLAGNVGYVRARTWAGWDVRVEDERSRPVARISQGFEGLDRAVLPADGYVVRLERPLEDPQRSLVLAAALTIDTALKKESRGFS